MFYDTEVDILNSQDFSIIKTITADVQPFSGSMGFDYGISLEISKKAFCDLDACVTESCYFKIATSKYKVLEMKAWSDYLEVFLYKCKR